MWSQKLRSKSLKRINFSPVLSTVDLKFLLNFSVKNHFLPKGDDVNQAFSLPYLLVNKNYALKPLDDDQFTPHNSYLGLKKTLYGLKQSPRQLYDSLTKIFKDIELTQLPHYPCIFHSVLIPG